MMLLTRFWYAILSVALAGAIGSLFVAVHLQNRLRQADSKVIVENARETVDWFLRLDAMERVESLGRTARDNQVVTLLREARDQDPISTAVRGSLKKILSEHADAFAKDRNDAGTDKNPNMFFAVDSRGRVVASVNFDRPVREETFELGGLTAVNEALHGWVRDDTWVFDRNSMYRIVTRPVVDTVGNLPVGAIIAARSIDDSFARLVSARTLSNVMFYVAPPDSPATTVAVGKGVAPDSAGTENALFSAVSRSLFETDESYATLGRTKAPSHQGEIDLSFRRLEGESWDLGGGYVVAHKYSPVNGIAGLLTTASVQDRATAPVVWMALGALGALLIGILWTLLEHTLPIARMAREAKRMADGKQEAFVLSRLAGKIRAIAKDANDGFERTLAKGGGSRKPADLEQILGPLPATPQMSAFSFGFTSSGESSSGDNQALFNTMQGRVPTDEEIAGELGAFDEDAHWRQTFEQFIALREQLGEPTSGLSYEKFTGQLQKNKELLMQKTGCMAVRFTVYEKGGKAALKANPARGE
jgi:hypothetical protein